MYVCIIIKNGAKIQAPAAMCLAKARKDVFKGFYPNVHKKRSQSLPSDN